MEEQELATLPLALLGRTLLTFEREDGSCFTVLDIIWLGLGPGGRHERVLFLPIRS